MQILPLFLGTQAVSLLVRSIAGGMFPGWELILAPVFQALLWPGGDVAAARAAAACPGSRREPAAMTELRNTEHELSRFRLRVLAAAAFVLAAFGLLGARLAFLQIVKHDELQTQAENNRIAVVPVTPNRGLILDRNGVVLANNYSAYTLEIAPAKVANLEATIDQLAEVVEIQPRDRKRFRRLYEESRSAESLPIRTKLSDEEVARFTAQRFRFDGVEIKARLFRSYPLGEVGSHLIGYIGRINPAEKKQMEDDWSEGDLANYRGTEYIGKLGVEQSYESELHGATGFEEVEMSAGGRAVRRLRSSPATPGNALVMSIDIRLQALVEELFGDRRGALVAIDPRNGEILAFVSKPNFDPNLFVDGIDVESWKALNESPDKPLLNRALRGTYRRARRSSRSWPWRPSAWASGRRSRPSPTPATSTSATTVFATTRKAATAPSTCTSRSCSRATRTTTCSPTISASTPSTTSWRRSASAA